MEELKHNNLPELGRKIAVEIRDPTCTVTEEFTPQTYHVQPDVITMFNDKEGMLTARLGRDKWQYIK